MKKMNLVLIAILFACCTFAQTYKRKTPEEKAQKYTAEMVTEVNLDSAQKEKVYQINLSVSKQFDSLYASKPEKDNLRKNTIDILKKRDLEFRKILSNEQFLRFDDIQREKREKKQQERLEKEKQEGK